jgi:iron complex outermembrane receptor protein
LQRLRALLSVVLALSAANPAAGEALADDAPLDTMFVTAEANDRFGAISETHRRLDPTDVLTSSPVELGALVKRAPSAHVVTNSRGEALVYLRSAGERQVAVFFDGALLNVPWDNRYDLSILPSSVVGGVVSATGALSPQYGVNALGAVSLVPVETSDSARIEAFGGSAEHAGASVMGGGNIGSVEALGAFSFARRDGEPLSRNADLQFHQRDGELRTNTDKETISGLARLEVEAGAARFAAAALISHTERGVAPESDRVDARFWRYPEIKTRMAVLSGDAAVGPHSQLSGSFWMQDFRQTIDSYESALFDSVEDRDEGRDRTYGARFISRSTFGPTIFTASGNVLTSRHRQRLTAFTDGVAATADDLIFSQNAASVGADIEHFVTRSLQATVGGGVDWIEYTQTGDKPGAEPFAEPVFRAGLSWTPGDTMRFRAAIGQKSRMPTMRELFGTALNRFLINPELSPERIRTAELGWDYDDGQARFSIVAFGQDVKDTIDQRDVDGLRQRVNLNGSWVAGIESTGQVELAPRWRLSAHATYAKTRRKDAAADGSKRLAERPSVLARVALDYTHHNKARAGLEVLHTGRAFSVNESGLFEPLAISTQLNLYASYPFKISDGLVEVFIRGENVADALVEPQIGLPAPGRSVFGGMKFVF